MNKPEQTEKKISNIHQLIRNEMVKTFRMIRNCRNGKITLTANQILAGEALLRCAMEYSTHNPFRTIDGK